MSCNNINWKTYRQDFPKRYWEEGTFDNKLKKILEDLDLKETSKILDIGGGVFGTEVLRGYTVDLLDPYVNLPIWYRKKVSWKNLKEKYNLIICRGSLNYLSLDQIRKAFESLCDGGIFFANTFYKENVPEKRIRIVSKSPKTTEEIYVENGVLKHFLFSPEKSIHHDILLYSKKDYLEIFPNALFTQIRNSIYIEAKKELTIV